MITPIQITSSVQPHPVVPYQLTPAVADDPLTVAIGSYSSVTGGLGNIANIAYSSVNGGENVMVQAFTVAWSAESAGTTTYGRMGDAYSAYFGSP